MMKLRYARGEGGREVKDKIDRGYFDKYRDVGPYSEVWNKFSDPDYIISQIETVWGRKPPYRLLVAGSASGELVGALRERGVDAVGIENNKYIHAKTPKALKRFNKLGTVTDLPFKDDAFDFVIEDCLCHVTDKQIARAIRELHRIVKTGLIFNSITSDLPPALIDRYDLLRGVRKLGTWWEWSELFFGNGFDLSMNRHDTLEQVWEKTLAAGKGPGEWYADAESLRYSFFDKIDDED